MWTCLKITGWWFGTFIFPYTGNVIIPIDEVIFFRGVGILNHQPDQQLKKTPKSHESLVSKDPQSPSSDGGPWAATMGCQVW